MRFGHGRARSADRRPARPLNLWITRALVAVPALVALFFGAVLVYVNVIREDAPERLDADDLAEIVSGTTLPATITTAPPAATPAADDITAAGADGYAGTWTVTDESVFGYRVEEVLFGVDTEAAGRSSEITGELTISATTVDTAAFTVDVATILSDDERRDTQFRSRIMEIDRFPEAGFALTAPIELGRIPAPGDTVTATAVGDLTLHGVTQTVTFEVIAEAGPERFGVLGAIPIAFADYGIDNPSRNGITTEDHGLVEFVLVFERA